jgi:hypothetical protein
MIRCDQLIDFSYNKFGSTGNLVKTRKLKAKSVY